MPGSNHTLKAPPVLARPRAGPAQITVVIALGLLWLALMDIAVIEWTCKPLIAAGRIRECELEFSPGIFYWHTAFIPFGLVLFAMLGLAARDSRLAIAGMILFATGWEDLSYYLLQLQPLPASMPWLNIAPSIAWTRRLTGAPNVTATGLVISALAGIILAALACAAVTKMNLRNGRSLSYSADKDLPA